MTRGNKWNRNVVKEEDYHEWHGMSCTLPYVFKYTGEYQAQVAISVLWLVRVVTVVALLVELYCRRPIQSNVI